MKRPFALMLLMLLAALPGAQAQRLDDEYVQIFNLIQDADSVSSAQPSQALQKYQEARKGLERLQKSSPDWNPTVVAFRLHYVNSKIAAISPQATPSPAPQPAQPPPSPQELQAQLNASRQQTQQLQADKALLEAKLKEALALQPAQSDPRELARAEERIKALQKENDLLKVTVEKEKEKAKLTVAPQTTPATDQTQQSLTEANRQLAQQKELNSKLALEKTVLESQVKQLRASSVTSAAQTSSADAAQIKQLERDRELLQKQLLDANKELANRKEKPSTRKVKDLETQVTDLRARLATLEATKVPYSAEELALFKPSDTPLPGPNAPTNTARSFPAGTATLVSQAQGYFSAQQFDKAEAVYRQVLQLDQQNVPALASLAAVQVEAKQFDDADHSLKQAMAVTTEDPYTLYVLGLLRFRQARYDDALDALGRAAKLDPQKAEVQNYLGLALSEKGLRGPAETALRKAIELQPGYAGAHYNLAVFYITQQPKYPALARWHYQKALSTGFPRNSDLEKLLDDNK